MSEDRPATVSPPASGADDALTASARTVAHVVYALQAASFLVGVTFLAAVIVNYVKRSDVRGTWVASHFRWQIRTFWFTLLWWILGAVTIYILIGYFVLVASAVWFIYRIAKGWLRLSDGRGMYV